ncbi:MAG: DUF1540 domain-containing protein [Clostridia bacterium]
MNEEKEKCNSHQCIKCNVASCAHNNVEHCSCLLDAIQVCPCKLDIDEKTSDAETACLSYDYVGNENIYGSANY